jgi:hypothetical protein
VNKDTIGDKIEALGKKKFQEALARDSDYVTLKLTELAPLLKLFKKKNIADVAAERFTLKTLEKEKVPISPIIRFLCECVGADRCLEARRAGPREVCVGAETPGP